MGLYEEMMREELARRGELAGGPKSYLLGGSSGGGSDPQAQLVAGPVPNPGASGAVGFGMTRVQGAPGAPAAQPTSQAVQPLPPQYRTTSQWSTSRTVLDDELKKRWLRMLGSRGTGGAVAQSAQAQISGAKQERAQRESTAAALGEHTKEFAGRRAKALERLDPEEQKLIKLVEDQARKRVDPDRWWSTRETGQQFGAVIGTILGGIAEGLSGGKVRNTAAQVVMKFIDNDIAAQKANILAGGQAVQAQQGVVNALYRRVGDVDRAEQLARVGLISQAQERLGAIQAENRGTMAAYNAKVAASQLEANKLQTMLQLTAKRVTGGGSRTKIPQQEQLKDQLMKRRIAMMDLQMEKMRRPPSWQQREAADAESATKKLQSYFKDWVRVGGAGNLQFLTKYLPSTYGKKLFRQKQFLALELAKAANGGRPTDIDAQRVEGALPGEWDDLAAGQYAMSRMLRYIKSRYDSNLRAVRAAGYTAKDFMSGKVPQKVLDAAAAADEKSAAILETSRSERF